MLKPARKKASHMRGTTLDPQWDFTVPGKYGELVCSFRVHPHVQADAARPFISSRLRVLKQLLPKRIEEMVDILELLAALETKYPFIGIRDLILAEDREVFPSQEVFNKLMEWLAAKAKTCARAPRPHRRGPKPGSSSGKSSSVVGLQRLKLMIRECDAAGTDTGMDMIAKKLNYQNRKALKQAMNRSGERRDFRTIKREALLEQLEQ